MTAITLTEAFLGHIFAGRMEEAMALVAPEARFVGARPEFSADNPLFGTYIGPDGAKAFFAAFAAVIEPGDFKIEARFGADGFACFFGTLRHIVRATGRPFASDWALVTRIEVGQLTLYHFYEDTAALSDAMQVA
ncbi:MAG: nuclear transport factor 2 family protein [Paracoccaceae bacterium]